MPRGVQIVGLVAPDQALTGPYLQAHQHFTLTELHAAIAFHVDTIRFQVSQFGLDPGSPLYSSPYARDIVDAVHMVRRLGLSVIVSVQRNRQQARTIAARCRTQALFASGTSWPWLSAATGA